MTSYTKVGLLTQDSNLIKCPSQSSLEHLVGLLEVTEIIFTWAVCKRTEKG